MPLIQRIDEKKFRQKPLYSYRVGANGVSRLKGSGLKPLNNHPIFLQKQGALLNAYGVPTGGAFDLSSIINAVGNTIAENKDTISTIASSVGSVANMSKSISDTVKASKELEKLKTIQEIKKNNKKTKDVYISPEQIASLEKLGNGFVKT
jgi:hypothetical protein